MPDSVIKKVESYSKLPALPGIFNFANRNGILFEWNEEVDKFPEGIVEVEDVVLYPSLAVEHPEVVLGQDQPLPSIIEELIPQGCTKDAVARSANLQPFDVAEVPAALPIMHTNMDKLKDYQIDNDDDVILMVDIPQPPPHAPLVVNDTNNDNTTRSDDETMTQRAARARSWPLGSSHQCGQQQIRWRSRSAKIGTQRKVHH